MSWSRIYGLILRYSYLLKRNPDRAVDTFYWPTIELLVWGLTGYYIGKVSNNNFVIEVIASGIVFYFIIFRIQGEVSVNLLEEYWSRSLVNIFVAPVIFGEWVLATMLSGITKALLGFVYTGLLALFLYHVHVFSYGLYLIPLLLSLMLTGWALGFFVSGLVFRYGTKVQFFAWTFTSIFTPFSAIYYPISALPFWAQKIAAFIPTSYVFEGLRQVISTGQEDPKKIIISLSLNALYICASIFFLRSSFKKALEYGIINIR